MATAVFMHFCSEWDYRTLLFTQSTCTFPSDDNSYLVKHNHFYFVELYHNQTMNRRSKMKWLQLFLFTGQFGMMFYWKNIFGKHWGYQFETELALSPSLF